MKTENELIEVLISIEEAIVHLTCSVAIIELSIAILLVGILFSIRRT